jgi:hypothetical protein
MFYVLGVFFCNAKNVILEKVTGLKLQHAKCGDNRSKKRNIVFNRRFLV